MSAQEPLVPPVMAEESASGLFEQHEPLLRVSASMKPQGSRAGLKLSNVARRTLGIFLLLVTVFLWTASNFLSSVCQMILPKVYGGC